MKILLATFKERKICVIDGYIFYLSSGKNSAKAGFANTWVPIRGLEESGIGSFVKPYIPNRSLPNSEIIKLVMGDEFFRYYEEKIGPEYEDFPDELLKEQFCRLGNIKAACISLKIGSGFWEKRGYKDDSQKKYYPSTAEIIKEYLEISGYLYLDNTDYNFVDTGKVFKSYREALDWLIIEQSAIHYSNRFPSSEEILENKTKQKKGFINTRRDNFYNEGDYKEECLTPTFPGLNEQWYKEQQTQIKAATKIQSIYRGHATRNAMELKKKQFFKEKVAINKEPNTKLYRDKQKGGITIGRGDDVKFYPNKQKGGVTVGREHNAKFHPICVYCKGAGFIGQNIKCTCCNGFGYV
ncbi:hypothetical protein IB642_01735 [Allofrancisella guangzhouensis]|uniref:Uncharacterized protein n=1 Tax=Allofrancisella guangzhouensis TaxID=594679 RepID=A0A0A8E5B5_9GAMM|nr:hypothetical protein [Allofrancisella guangzhouensis]AJC49420.1 hypothetical protein SD28_07220 [Allofrancisella guangzhouensis]MBK2026711.1 hypothetical protein [Allofrancisella guangzhouensis]MBK2043738.1 hypothetical protein [Allofrancisella guangzhouensis]MBK2046209.1 hypothetical protein [Allofrancisella guangzhouensis]